jgi:hypothetical protein
MALCRGPTWCWEPRLPRSAAGAISATYRGVYSDAAPAPAPKRCLERQECGGLETCCEAQGGQGWQ